MCLGGHLVPCQMPIDKITSTDSILLLGIPGMYLAFQTMMYL